MQNLQAPIQSPASRTCTLRPKYLQCEWLCSGFCRQRTCIVSVTVTPCPVPVAGITNQTRYFFPMSPRTSFIILVTTVVQAVTSSCFRTGSQGEVQSLPHLRQSTITSYLDNSDVLGPLLSHLPLFLFSVTQSSLKVSYPASSPLVTFCN